ncbi:GNAT family N-acetyltransferase [Undibacterium arcticum]|uniref:L-ornithine N(alpha)-acyltransferase n=1 Tax=Undibacterium arcticum TaxID=1762892 RepID=A0ABV7F557_9BURK
MQLPITSTESTTSAAKLVLSLATTPKELREVQRLRYKVFVDGMGLSALANEDRLDQDEFDDYCDHLIVRDSQTLKVVGTYRLLSASAARRIGRFYSESEFDLSRLDNLRDRMVEAGRACIHPNYRSGSVIMLLWSGLAAYMQRERCDYLIGCASMSLADGGHNAAAVYNEMSKTYMAAAEYGVTPHLPFPIQELSSDIKPQIPPLIKGYLRSGGWICGAPAWDPQFHSADLFLILRLSNLDQRYARHYGTEEGGK